MPKIKVKHSRPKRKTIKKALYTNKQLILVGTAILVLFILPLTLSISKMRSDTNSLAVGNELFVSSSGTGDCSQASPCSFSQADSQATPGTTVHVAAGSYGNVTISKSGSATSPIHWISDTKWGAKMSGDTTSTVEISAAYVNFEGFDVTGGADTQNLIDLGPNSTATGNHVHDSTRGGCTYNGGIVTGGNTHVIGNLIENIGQGTPGNCNEFHGIYNDSNDVIENNVIINVPNGSGIQSWHSTTHVTIINNTVIGAGADGILVGSDTGSNTGGYIANNISVNNHRNGLSETGTATGNTFVNNLSFGNGGDATSITSGSTVTGLITADPMFVNAAAGDYHLQAGSPAIDKGAAAQAPTTDFDGKTRPIGAAIDLGAFETGTGTGAAPSTAPAVSIVPSFVCAGSGVGSVCPSGSPSQAPISTAPSSTQQQPSEGPVVSTSPGDSMAPQPSEIVSLSPNPGDSNGGNGNDNFFQLLLNFFMKLIELLESLFKGK